MLRLLGMKLLPRLLLCVCSLCALSLLLFSRCGLHITEDGFGPGIGPPINHLQERRLPLNTSQEQQGFPSNNNAPDNKRRHRATELLQQREEEHRRELSRLTSEIRQLKLQLLQLKGYVSPYTHSPEKGDKAPLPIIANLLSTAEILQGMPYNNEYEIIPFSHFSLTRIYPVDLGLGKRVIEKPMGARRKDLSEVLLKAIETLNCDRRGKTDNPKLAEPAVKTNVLNQTFTVHDFVEGLYRTDATTGTQYEFYFRSKDNTTRDFIRVTLVRPFAAPIAIATENVPIKPKETVHVVLALSGRTATFQSFMDKFVKIALRNDKHVHLTVVYFGDEGLAEARTIMGRVVQTWGGHWLRLLALNETFSRAKGLRVGAERTGGNSDALLFMCDVDVVFSARFLDRCRWNARPGRNVYYPIVFSLYNPYVVYTLQGKPVPSEAEQLVVSRDTGFWRDFGYGMTCQYRSDFLRVHGFNGNIVGWGGEDVGLYRKYVRSPIKVIRATDPGIFHIWHSKVCANNGMSADQYRACIRSRALNEASQSQLGFLAFKDEISRHLPPHDTSKLNKQPKSKAL